MVEVFLERARQLSIARDLVREDAEYASATALLAVHTAIAVNDALLMELSGERYKGADHRRALKATERMCTAKNIRTAGLKHFRTLLSKKTDVSYGEDRISFETASALAYSSQRFEEWALSILKMGRRVS